MFGKRGANPPLPRNCKRRGQAHNATGGHSGKAAEADNARVRRPVLLQISEGKAMVRASRVFGHTLWFAAAFTLIPALANAAAIHGSILDPTGAVIPRAKVELIESHSSITTVTTDANGQYRLQWTPAPDASLRISAPAFRSEEKALPSESSSNELTVDFVLSLASLSEQITVTSTGTPTPQSQLGTTVTTLSQQDSAGTRDLAQVLSWIPGLQVTHTGQAGGTTSLFIRGGSSDANKLLIYVIPADDIGGNV